MRIIKVPTAYYSQFSADYSLRYPAEGYGGWKKEKLDLNLSKTGFVVMHAWNPYSYDEYKGWYQAVEYLPRAKEILETTLPQLLETLRKHQLKIYHIVDEKHIPFTKLANPGKDDVIISLEAFKSKYVFPGEENEPACKNVIRNPMLVGENESMLYNGEELHELCLKDGINHLIYSGFAINFCLQYSPGNMNEMCNRGFMCSCIKETVTAVENKESIIGEQNKQYGLWLTSIKNGFVYNLEELITALENS
ncbi:MAG: hypothetical protein JXQ23_00925 [Clostridia bacterium]|nr:hypothetical protein [Clostridia bacterium]